jgi:hypothetical protein
MGFAVMSDCFGKERLAMTKGEDRDSGLLRAYGPRNDEGPVGPHPRPSLRGAFLSDEVRLLDPPHRRILGADNLINH